jgi:PEP-CTERM motif
MKKKLVALLAGAMMMMATSAMALPVLETGYGWVNTSFWNFTDFTTANSDFEIKLENASYESDFGLYTVDSITSPTTVLNKFKIFGYNDEANKEATIKLRTVSGQLQISNADVGTWINFDKNFGFYYDVHTGGRNDDSVDYSYYTFSALNTMAQNVQHIITAFNPNKVKAMIYLDDQLVNPDGDWNDMTIKANDIAPVPEPGTMVLLGAGLLGLAVFGKRRMNKEA